MASGQAGRQRWTDAIHDEWLRNVLKDNPQLSPERLARTRSLMNEAVSSPARTWARPSSRSPDAGQLLDPVANKGKKGKDTKGRVGEGVASCPTRPLLTP